MNFKSIILAAAVGLTSLGVMPEAKAAECTVYDDFAICMQMVSRNGSWNTWDVTVTNNYWSEEMQIVCNGKTMDNWASRGGASQTEADKIARLFCAL